MLEGQSANYFIDFTRPSPLLWTNPGPLIGNILPRSTNNHPVDTATNPNIEKGVRTVKGIDERPQKDGTTSYRARVSIKGHPTVTKTFKNLTTAKRWKRNTEAEIDAGRYFDKIEAKKHTLGEAIDRYLKNILPSKPNNAKNVQHHLLWWKDRLGAYSLDAIKPSLLAEQRDLLLTEINCKGRKRSSTTVIRYLSSLSHVFTIMIKEWGWLNENPIRKITKPRQQPGRVRYLSDEERVRLLKACQNSRCRILYLTVLLALSTGMRYGELMGLKRSNIDWEQNVITLYETKNGETRSIPIGGEPLELLKKHVLHLPSFSDLIFPSSHHPKKPIDIRSAWKKAAREASVLDFRFHDLRHTTASYLAMNGYSLLDIATLLGHKDLQMTKRYAHLSQEHKKKMVSAMTQIILKGQPQKNHNDVN